MTVLKGQFKVQFNLIQKTLFVRGGQVNLRVESFLSKIKVNSVSLLKVFAKVGKYKVNSANL